MKPRDIKAQGLPHQIRAQCPQCNRTLHGIPFMYVAVVHSHRTCPKCGTAWLIKATPTRRQESCTVTTLEWLAL